MPGASAISARVRGALWAGAHRRRQHSALASVSWRAPLQAGGPENAVPAAAMHSLPARPQRFRPITVERPKVLLPLVNAPLIEYTLEWLALNKVEEVRHRAAAADCCMIAALSAPVRHPLPARQRCGGALTGHSTPHCPCPTRARAQIFVFCCAHADQIKKYLAESKWLKQRSPRIFMVRGAGLHRGAAGTQRGRSSPRHARRSGMAGAPPR